MMGQLPGKVKGRDKPHVEVLNLTPDRLTVAVNFELRPDAWVELTFTRDDLVALLAEMAGAPKESDGKSTT